MNLKEEMNIQAALDAERERGQSDGPKNQGAARSRSRKCIRGNKISNLNAAFPRGKFV